MWEDFWKEEDLSSLGLATRKVLLRFLNRANRNSLHPKDERYFYEFIRYAHAHRARLNGLQLERILCKAGFTENKAQRLVLLYECGRAVLASSCPVVRDGVVYS